MSFILPPDWPSDPTTVEYAKYIHAYFSGGLTNKPFPFETIGVNTGEPKCSQNPALKPKAMINQVITGMVMAGIVAKKAPQRGILVYHGTGSGKTGTTVALMDALWDMAGVRIVYVTSVDALASNPTQKFYALARHILPRFQDMTTTEVERAFNKRKVAFLSFAQLAHQLMLANPLKVTSNAQKKEFEEYLKGALLIIDEVHGIFHPLPTQKKEHDALRAFLLDSTSTRTESLRLAILTATPGDTVVEVMALLNMIRNPNSPTIEAPDANNEKSMDLFKQRVQGLVSYLDMSSDTTRYPRLISDTVHDSPMSLTQFVKYLDAWQQDMTAKKGFTTTRKYNNMLFHWSPDMALSEFSAKIPALLSNIDRHPRQKHYVYSSFGDRRGNTGQGIYGIALFLQAQLGYAPLTFQEAEKHDWISLGRKKRYVLVTNAELSSTSISKRRADKILSSYLAIFNAPENRHGEYVHVLLASQNYFQAMDLAAIRHIHIFEPFTSKSSDIQAIGRGRRYCSHRDLLFDGEWTVAVYRYISSMPLEIRSVPLETFKIRLQQWQSELKEESTKQNANMYRIQDLKDLIQDAAWKDQARRLRMIDDIIMQEVKTESQHFFSILKALQESSLDCRVFAKMHGITCNE